MFRRFGVLHARSLLYKQAELTNLEAKLERLDKADAAGSDKWKNSSYPILGDAEGDDRAKAELMAEIDMKMKEYGMRAPVCILNHNLSLPPDDLLLRDHKLSTLRRPTQRLHRFLFDYFWNEHPVEEDDERFVYKKDDFVCITPHPEFGWFDDILHWLMDRSFLKVCSHYTSDMSHETCVH